MTKATNNKENEFYRIEAGYQKGGINYANYKNERRGIYIFFNIVEISDNCIRSRPLSNTSYKIYFKELSRKSKKQIDLAEKWIENNEALLFELYTKQDVDGLLDLVQSEHLFESVA